MSFLLAIVELGVLLNAWWFLIDSVMRGYMRALCWAIDEIYGTPA